MNSNFMTLAAWVDAKVGGAASSAATATAGGTVVIRGPGAENLGLDGDDIYARVGSSAGTLFLQRSGAGAVAVGGNGPNTSAKLQVNGTLSATRVETNQLVVGSDGSQITKVRTGTIGTCSSPNSAGSTGTVSFGATFASAPIVFAMPAEPDNAGCTSVRIMARSTADFSFVSWVGGTQTACDCINWIAIGN